MNDLGTNFAPVDTALQELQDREPRLGFVAQEPLDTMLKLERSPPPLLNLQGGSAGADVANPLYQGGISNLQKLQAVQMKVKLAELVVGLEDDIMQSGDQAVIDGFSEVHRFLVHSEHLRALQEG